MQCIRINTKKSKNQNKFPISTALDYSKALGPLDLCLIKNIEPALDGLIQWTEC